MCYVSASGGEIWNEGEINITHKEKNGDVFDLKMQNAKVSCPIRSMKYFANMGCRVLFKKGGGVIAYQRGNQPNCCKT